MAKFPAKLFDVLEGLDDESAGLIIINNISGGLTPDERTAVRAQVVAKSPAFVRALCLFRDHHKPQFLVCSLRRLLQVPCLENTRLSDRRTASRTDNSSADGGTVGKESKPGRGNVIAFDEDFLELSSEGDKAVPSESEVPPGIKESTVLGGGDNESSSSKMISADSNLILFGLQQPDQVQPKANQNARDKPKRAAVESPQEKRMKDTETRFRQLIHESRQYVRSMANSPVSSPQSRVQSTTQRFLFPGAGGFLSPRAAPPLSSARRFLSPGPARAGGGDKENTVKRSDIRILSPREAIRSPFIIKPAASLAPQASEEAMFLRLRKLSFQSCLRYVELQDLLKSLKKAAAQNGGLITRPAFVRATSELVDQVFRQRMPEVGAIKAFTFLVPSAPEQGVPFAELVGGLSLLCKGSGIEKMSVSFHYMSQSYVGIELHDFRQYLQSIFRTLFGPASLSSESERMAKSAEDECTRDITLKGDRKVGGKIDAPNFHRWIADSRKELLQTGRNTRRASAVTILLTHRGKGERRRNESQCSRISINSSNKKEMGLFEANVGRFYNRGGDRKVDETAEKAWVSPGRGTVRLMGRGYPPAENLRTGL